MHRVGGVFNFSDEPEAISVDIEKESATGPDTTVDKPLAPVPTTQAPVMNIVQSPDLSPKAQVTAAKLERTGALTADDLRGLTPKEVDAIMGRQVQLNALSQQLEETLGTTAGKVEASRLRQTELAKQTADSIHKAKETAARAIAESDLPPEEQAKRLEVLSKATTLQDVYDLSVQAYALPKRENVGTDREAISSELFNLRYAQLSQEQKARVNAEAQARSPQQTDVVTNEDGVFVVDKRSGTARLVTVAPSSTNKTPAGTVYRQVSPVTSELSQRTQGATVLENVSDEGISRLAADIKNVGKEQAIELYSSVILQNSSPLAQRTFRAALVRAYPDLDATLPRPTQQFMSDTEATTPEARMGTGATAQVRAGEPLRGKEPPKPTGEALKAYNFGLQMIGSNQIISRLEAKGETGTGVLLSPLESIASQSVTAGVAAGAATGGAAGTALGVTVLPFIVGMVLRNPAYVMTPKFGGIVGGGVGSALGAGVGAATVLLADPLVTVLRRLKGADAQSYFQAKSDFIAAVLRKQSGAAINRDEYVREEKRYFPSVLDTPEVIKQKAQARERAIKGIEKEAGRRIVPE